MCRRGVRDGSRAGAATRATPCCCPTTAPGCRRPRSPAQSGGVVARRARRPVPVPGRLALPAARLSRPDRLHAERIGSRAGARHHDRRRCASVLERAGRALLSARACRRCSSRAAAAAWRSSQPSRPTVHIPIFGSDEVADVTGAGDTVIATFDAGARRRRVVLRSRAARQLRRRARRDEARHARPSRRRSSATRWEADRA